MSFVHTLRDRLLARAARLSASVEESRKPPPVDRAQLQAETQARNAALTALAQQDVALAMAALEPVIATARQAQTLSLHAHLFLVRGLPEEAQVSLERAVALEPGDVLALDALAALLQQQRAFVQEYPIRKQRLLAPTAFGCREVIDAIASLARAVAHGAELAPVDLDFVVRQYDRIAAAATSPERIEFAEWLFTLKPGRARARTLIEQNIPQDANWGTRVLALTSPADLPRAAVLKQHESPDEGLENVVLRAVELADAAVLPDFQWSPWLPGSGKVIRGYTTRRGITARQEPESALLAQNNRQLLVRLPIAKPRRIQGVAILVGTADNHYRFLVEHLSRIATLAALGISADGARWIVGKKLLPYQRKYFTMLGVLPEQLLPVDVQDNLVFEHLIAASSLGRGPKQISALMPRWAREVLVPSAGAVLAAKPLRRVYLSAAPGTGRGVLNEAELAVVLNARGFDCVNAEDLDLPALIQLLAQSCELVTPLGPNMAFMLFMPEGGRITALYNSHVPPDTERLEFDYVARACKHKLQAVAGTPASWAPEPVSGANFKVKVEELAAALDNTGAGQA